MSPHPRDRRSAQRRQVHLSTPLTRNDVLAANYPFATIEPNIGVVELPDVRLTRLAEIFGSVRILPATVSSVDIAGIVKGASGGRGMGNQFLANIREADAICQVVRVRRRRRGATSTARRPARRHRGHRDRIDLADMQTLEKAILRLEKEAKKKGPGRRTDRRQAGPGTLNSGKTLFSQHDCSIFRPVQPAPDDRKPFLHVFNADEPVPHRRRQEG